jgi:hypothetical protein
LVLIPFGVSKDPHGSHVPNRDDASPEGSEVARRPPSEHEVHATEDATLGGYIKLHERPPAFEGVDGQPYSVSIEVEKTPNLARPFVGYLVFPRWAETGLGIVGHVETPILSEGTTRAEVVDHIGDLPLLRVKELLDEAIREKEERAVATERAPTDRPE